MVNIRITNLTLDELGLIAQSRNVSSYENKSEEDLIEALSEPKPEKNPETKPKQTPKQTLTPETKSKQTPKQTLKPETKTEIKVSGKKLKKT